MMKRVSVFVAVVALASSIAMAVPTLTQIVPLVGQTASDARAITPDGKYVAGNSGANGIFWSPGAGTVKVDNGSSSHTNSTGIGYRTVAAGTEIVVGGNDSSGWVSAFGAADPGAGTPTWLWRARDANSSIQGASPRVPAANSVGGTAGVNWYMTHDQKSASNVNISIEQGSGDPTGVYAYGVKSTPYRANVRGVSGTGRAVGIRRDVSTGSPNQNYYWNWVGATTPSQTKFKGLKAGSFDGDPFSISLDGTKIGGMAPVDGGRAGNWPYLYDVTTDTIEELPTFPDTAGSTTNAVVYGVSPDGKWAVGQNYRGVERACIWNTIGNGITDLTSWATTLGIMGNFVRLSRAYTVGVDADGQPVVAGVGVYNDGGVNYNRGFVFVLPEPATLAFLALGGVAVLRRRR